MTGNHLARAQKNQQDRQSGNGTSKEDRGKDMKMDRTGGSDPSARGDPQGHANSCQPLQCHETGEQAVGTLPDLPTMTLKMVRFKLSQVLGFRLISVR